MGWSKRMQCLPFERSFEAPFSRQIITCKSFALWAWLEHQKNHEKSFTVRGIRQPLRHCYEDYRPLGVKSIILCPLLLEIILTYTLQLILHRLVKFAEKMLTEQMVWVSLSKLFSDSSINPISLNDQLNNTPEHVSPRSFWTEEPKLSRAKGQHSVWSVSLQTRDGYTNSHKRGCITRG